MGGGFKTLAQRKLEALKAANQARAATRVEEEAEDEPEVDDQPQEYKDESEASSKKQKTLHSSSATGENGDENAPIIVSDATADESAMLGAYFPSSFGAAPKPQQDLAAVAARHRRKDTGADGALMSPSRKVKLEGGVKKEEGIGSAASASRPAPQKVKVPVAPAALLGSAYDSTSDEEDDDDAMARNGPAAVSSAASSSSGVPAARATAAMSDDESDADSDDEDAGPSPLLRTLPISHEVEMKTNGHTKTVSALSLDRSGSRVVSGAYDYQMKLWNFSGMNEEMAAFRTVEPQEGHQIRSLQFSNTGDMILVVTGSAQPKLFTRDGMEVCQFVRGDMYLVDQKSTKGHSSAVTTGFWHPTDRTCAFTAGIDGTVRIWDVNDTSRNIQVIKPRWTNMRGTTVSAAAISKDGRMIAAAGTDGSIRLLRQTKSYDYRDDKVVFSAHTKGSETSSLLFSSDGWSLFSRGGDHDHTLKMWDIRAFKQPVHIVANLENSYPETDLTFSPDEKVLVTGTSSREKASTEGGGGGGGIESGHAVFIERSTMKPIQRVSLGCRSVVRSVWHAGINQLLFGCSDGAIRLLYDPTLSTKGALLCIGKKARSKPPTDFQQSVGAILTPHALPSMRTSGDGLGVSRKRSREKAAAAMAPQAPLHGKVGVGGRAPEQQTITAYHLSKSVAMRHDPREKDPREALLAMDELAKADPMFFGRAYAATQPKPILAEVPEEEQVEQLTEEQIAIRNKKEGQAHAK